MKKEEENKLKYKLLNYRKKVERNSCSNKSLNKKKVEKI